MNILAGLNKYEAVEIDGELVVELGNYEHNRYFTVDGNKINNTSGQVIIKKSSILIEYKKVQQEILGYDLPDGSFVEFSVFKTIWEEYPRNDYDEVEYPSLEAEFEHRKKLEVYHGRKPVYTNTPDICNTVDINIVGKAEQTGSKHITNPLSVGQGTWGNSKFYKVNSGTILAEVLSEFCKEHRLELDYPSHSKLRFATANGNYIFTGRYEDVAEGKRNPLFGSLKEAKEYEENFRKELLGYLRAKLLKDLPLTKPTANLIWSKLSSLTTSINNLEVKQKSYYSKRTIGSALNELLSMLEKEI